MNHDEDPMWYSAADDLAAMVGAELSACCWSHDGPHLHGCVVPRTEDGSTHAGACLLERVR